MPRKESAEYLYRGTIEELNSNSADILHRLFDSNEFVIAAVLSLQASHAENTHMLSVKNGSHLNIEVNIYTEDNSCIFTTEQAGHVINLPRSCFNQRDSSVFYLTFDKGKYLSVFLDGKLLGFIETVDSHNFCHGQKLTFGSGFTFHELILNDSIPEFAGRFRLHRELDKKYGTQSHPVPVMQFYNMLISGKELLVRDPSEILHANDRYWIYFTGIRPPENHGFRGSVWCSSCSDKCDPSIRENWSGPVEVIEKGNPQSDHDGTGCFTPDCFYDGEKFFVFYTGLNSTHEKGIPDWENRREPEHIMVASSLFPNRGLEKTKIQTLLTPDSKTIGYNEATIPGGHESWMGKAIGDVGLIDHGQCWIMDNGQRRYYYKGGVPGHGGSVHMMEGFDSEWLNGKRRSEPVICEHTHMEGILITRVDDTMFMQLSLIWKDRRWRTYTSSADDGINWKLVDEGYYPRLNYNYPQSIGVFQTNEPKWAIGQFLTEDDSIGLGYMRII